MRQREKEETALFYTGWALLGIACCILLLYRLFPGLFSLFLIPCVVQSTFGVYCPGCGGTRAAAALLQGDLITSFFCHPLVLYTAFTGGWFLISHTIERISRHRLKIGMKYRDIYVWAALIIVILNFLVKNLLLFVFHIDLLENVHLLS
ncbi:MAG: DUF2752 domain-containing protein [Lachnospiraceae bacterium]|nr:DUF2752 domain-containing protein [Lachnospiraceae bacterium]